MARFFSLFVFIVYKAVEAATAVYFMNSFEMRQDILAYGFYGFLSFFQFLFILAQSLSKPKTAAQSSVIFQYTTIIVILMGLLSLAAPGAYLRIIGNDLFRILFILTLLTGLQALFFLVHGAVFNAIIKTQNIVINHVSVLPNILFILIGFGVPLAYLLSKTLIDRKVTPRVATLDILMVSGVIGLNALITLLLFVGKTMKASRIGRRIHSISSTMPEAGFQIDDPNELGYVEAALSKLTRKLVKEKEAITLLNDYISSNMRGEIAKYGVNMLGESKTASIVTIRYSFLSETMPPEDYVKMVNLITRIIGEYADEYEAYPIFQLSKAVVVYGAPFYYEHQKYNAIEATQKTITDIQKTVIDAGFNIKISTGIYTGGVITGAVNTRGRNYKEYLAMGAGVDISEKIAFAAENISVPILVCNTTFDNMKNKFTSDKSFKIKLKNGEELVVHQIRV